MKDKKELRKKTLAEINALPEEYIKSSDSSIREKAESLPEFAAAKTVFAYYSVAREPDTLKIIEDMLAQGKTVALPVSYPHGIMKARVIRGLDEVKSGRYGIPAPPETAEELQPEDIDLIIVPAVTFDREGYRLGYGGGYYDRFLEKTDAFSLGLGREKMLRPVPIEAHDKQVMCLVTEENVYRFK